jgi:hypothetical protein
MTKTLSRPITVGKVPELTYVDDDKSYYLTLQIGHGTRWRKYGGGQWKQDPNLSQDAKEKVMVHHPAIHERCGPFSGPCVNGLIALHNKWRLRNREKATGGEIQRQLLVLATEETVDQPIDAAAGGMRMAAMIRAIVKETVTAVMEEVIGKQK